MIWGMLGINTLLIAHVAGLYGEHRKLQALGHGGVNKRLLMGITAALTTFSLLAIYPKALGFLVLCLVCLGVYKSGQRQRELYMTTRCFYKIYKYFQIQIETGARPEDILKSLFRIVDYPRFREKLFRFSAIISQSHDAQQGLNYLKSVLDDPEGKIFVSITENLISAGGRQETFTRLNHLLFQKYLSNIREDTKRIKRMYLYAVILFSGMITAMLLIPLIHQMMVSAKMIFN